MITGPITQSTFPEILRSLAVKKKNGVLSISSHDRTIVIDLFQSKIVEVVEPGSAPQLEVLDMLVMAGRTLDGSIDSYGALEHVFKVPREIVRRAVKHRILEKLTTFQIPSEGAYSFDAKIPDFDHDYSPLIPVSNFLLDYVSIEGDAIRFEGIFETGTFLKRGETVPDDLSEEEAAILECVGDDPVEMDEAKLRSILSTFSFQKGLLSLYEAGAVQIVEGVRSEELSTSNTEPVEIAVITEADSESSPTQKPKFEMPKMSIPLPIKNTLEKRYDELYSLLLLLFGMALPLILWGDVFGAF